MSSGKSHAVGQTHIGRHGDVRHSCDAASPAVPLTTALAGQAAHVAVIDGSHGATARLADLGVLPGHVVRMIRPSRRGPVLVEVKGSRLALGHRLASQILVRLPGDRVAAE